MNGFERRKEQKKNSILESALTLFLKYGVNKVTISEIAKDANVSQVTIYNYFESKDNLVREVLTYYVNKIWEKYERLFDSDLPFPDKVKKIIFDKSLVAGEVNEDFFKQFMLEYSKESNFIEQFYREKALPRFMKLFEEGKEQGFVDQNISNEAILFYIQMFADYMRREEIADSLLPLTEDLTKIFFYGVAGKREDD